MRSPRSVTLTPTGIPSRSLKFEIDFLAWRSTGCCPVMVRSSSTASSITFLFCDASPMPLLTTIFVIRGTCITFEYSNCSVSAGTISER